MRAKGIAVVEVRYGATEVVLTVAGNRARPAPPGHLVASLTPGAALPEPAGEAWTDQW